MPTARRCAGRRAAAHAGDTNIKVASVNGIGTTLAAASLAGATNIKVDEHPPFFTTTLAAAANAGDTNIKVANVTELVAGPTINIDTGAARREPCHPVRRHGGRNRHGRHADVGARLGARERSPVTPAGQKVNVDTGAGQRDGDGPGRRHRRRRGTGLTLTAPLATPSQRRPGRRR